MLTNTRDLGGIVTQDGKKIVSGKLIRGGMLIKASREELDKLLSVPVTRVIDFRTPMETVDYPDPELSGVEILNLAPVKNFQTGITREKNTESTIIGIIKKTIADDPLFTRKYFVNFYEKLVDNDFAIAQYSRFIRLLAEERDGATFWHCTAGKDRAGAAAMLIEEILGVDHDTIIEDYMKTNIYIEQDIQDFIRKMEPLGSREVVEGPVRDFFGARIEYIEATYGMINREFGGMEIFLRDKLGVDDALKSKLRRMYLE